MMNGKRESPITLKENDIMNVQESIKKAIPHLLKLQRDDGRFEGELSSNIYPTCTYALVQLALDRAIDDDLIRWFIKSQNDAGFWGLDMAGGSDKDSTLLAKLALTESNKNIANKNIESTLSKIPDLKLNQWIVKLLYARAGYIPWKSIDAPKTLSSVMQLGEKLAPILPKSLVSRFKPPNNYAPPVRLFYTQVFEHLFIAEKQTLAPLFIIMEIHNKNRRDVVSDLMKWHLNSRCKDGSWFRVGFITALSVLAFIDAKNAGYGNNEVESAIHEGYEWLQNLRSSDGGCREAINLNVWDTALSMLALSNVNSEEYKPQLDRSARWLLENQNDDDGWAFSGIPGGNLPSDADDTSLTILALLHSGISKDHDSVKKGVDWLKKHQSANGGWGTYRPGAGDVDCISITSHVISAFLEVGSLDKEISKAIEWIRNSISDSGYWKDLWLAKNTYGTALAIEALIKTGHKECEEVKRGIKWLESCQNPDGGWGEDINGSRIQSTIEQTAWSTYAILLDNPESQFAKKGIDYIMSHQNPDGSWNPSCVGIYWEVIGGYADPIDTYIFALMALNSFLDK
jgi:squalene-hopene/tetraprenyl-beta-curcumene cyclase